jgi:hypothetical protein
MSVIPRRRVEDEYSYTDIVLLTLEGAENILPLITKAQEWNLIPRDNEIKCPSRGCDGKLEMRPRSAQLDGFIWRCGGHKGSGDKKKSVRCRYE